MAVTGRDGESYHQCMQRLAGLVVLAIVLFWIIDAPTSAAGTVNEILNLLANAAQSIITFLRALF